MEKKRDIRLTFQTLFFEKTEAIKKIIGSNITSSIVNINALKVKKKLKNIIKK